MAARPQLTPSELVWNRACGFDSAGFREGDLALAAVILVDGYIQNGGVGHAFDLTPEELAAGIAGFEYFGLHEMATIIRPHKGLDEAEHNRRYYAFSRPVNHIRVKFNEMFRDHPERFAPLSKSPPED